MGARPTKLPKESSPTKSCSKPTSGPSTLPRRLEQFKPKYSLPPSWLCHQFMCSQALKDHLLPDLIKIILLLIIPKGLIKDSYTFQYDLGTNPTTPQPRHPLKGMTILRNGLLLAHINNRLGLFDNTVFFDYFSTETIKDVSSITESPNGKVWVVESPQIKVFSPAGLLLDTFEPVGYKGTWGIASNQRGNIIISNNPEIQTYTQQWELISQFGSSGELDGSLSNPRGIAIDLHDNIIVADNGNNRVQVFSASGEFVRVMGGLFYPWSVVVDSQGRIAVTDFGNYQVVVFSDNGDVICKFGAFGREGGQFEYTTALAIDVFGNLYVGDHNSQRYIQYFA